MNRQTVLIWASWGGWLGTILLCLAVYFSPAPAHILWSWVMFCGIVSLIARGNFKTTRLDLPILLYIVSLAIASILTNNGSSLAKPPLYFLFFATTQLELKTNQRQQIVWIFVFAAFCAFVWGTFFYLENNLDRLLIAGIGYTALATLFLFALALLWGWMVTMPKLRLWLSLANLPLLVALVLTFCRAQWLAALAQSIVLAFRHYKKMLWIGLGIIIIATTALIVLPRHQMEIERFSLGDPQFVSHRDIIYEGAAESFAIVPPIGFGPGSFFYIFPLSTRFHNPVEHIGGWHNDIIQAYLEGGILGLMFYLWMIITAISVIYNQAKSINDPWMKGSSLGVAAATAGATLSAMLCNVATVPMVIMGQTLLWGLVLGITSNEPLKRID